MPCIQEIGRRLTHLRSSSDKLPHDLHAKMKANSECIHMMEERVASMKEVRSSTHHLRYALG